MKYLHNDVLLNGVAYLVANCDRVIVIDSYQTSYATVAGSAAVAHADLVSGDFDVVQTDGDDTVLTIGLNTMSAGLALKDVPDGANIHLAFVDVSESKVLYVTGESTAPAVVTNDIVQFSSDVTLTFPQPA